MLIKIFSIFGLLLFVGCSLTTQTATFTLQDAQTAATVAKAAGLPQDQQCWQTYAALSAALATTPAPTVGLLTLVELKRSLQATMGSPTCLPITMQLLSELLKVSSVQGNVISQFLGY